MGKEQLHTCTSELGMYNRFKCNLDKKCEIITFTSLLTTFKVSGIFRGSWRYCKNLLDYELKPKNQ